MASPCPSRIEEVNTTDPLLFVDGSTPVLFCWPVPEYTCGSHVHDDGASLCPGDMVPIADGDGVSCGVGQDCDDATCCEEGECIRCCWSPLFSIGNYRVVCLIDRVVLQAYDVDSHQGHVANSHAAHLRTKKTMSTLRSPPIAKMSLLSCWSVSELTCGSYVADDGASLCPDDLVLIAGGDGVSCGLGQDCDDATCCEEGECIRRGGLFMFLIGNDRVGLIDHDMLLA